MSDQISSQQSDPDLDEPAEDDAAPSVEARLGEAAVGDRLDRALAAALDPALGLSRSRLRALIEQGVVTDESGATLRDPSAKVKAAGVVRLRPPAPKPPRPQPEPIPLEVVFEDDALIVVNKPPGMAAHPAPGSETGTLVNAMLAHCGDGLLSVGGEARPGVVHRIDKETSGLLVMAKTDRAHQGLSAQFAAHSIDRVYMAAAWGAPDRADPRLAGLRGVDFAPRPGAGGDGDGAAPADQGLWGRIETEIARSRADRKKMAAVFSGGKRAVTWFRVRRKYGARPGGGAAASLIECRLETGRTHQIRVHMAYAGHGLIGDPLYGRASSSRMGAFPEPVRSVVAGFRRQALHAGALGFEHPISGEILRFEAPPPQDIQNLLNALEAL